MEHVYEFIRKLNIDNKCIVAAISGGPDSMMLLDILLSLREKSNIDIVVAHVHHNLRKESDEEALKLKQFCDNHNVTFEMMKIEEYPDNKFSEESARKIRYEFFDKVVKKYKSDILFTAHHGDDLIETILMRIVRGSSIKGYAGFETISNDRGYIIARPLVYLTKNKIEEYLNKKNIWYAKDMSNDSDKYTRNRYRKYILPELKKENNDVHYKFLELNHKLLLADDYLKRIAHTLYLDIVINQEIDINKFNKLDRILKIYILEEYLKNIYSGNIIDISYKHINIILDIMGKNNSIVDLPHNKKGKVEYNKFKVIEDEEISSYEYVFYDKVILPDGKVIEIDNSTTLTSNFVIHLNSNDIKLPFHVRTRKPGDRICVKNMLGTKKVNDIFTDSKIPSRLRETYPIVTDDTGKIIWIPGIKKSNFDMKKDKKYDIILKYN